MIAKRVQPGLSLLALGTFVASLSWATGRAAEPVGPSEKTWAETVDKALQFLRKSQNPDDGSFSKEKNIGVTGVVLTGVLQTGRVPPSDPLVKNGLKYLESLVNSKDGHIAGDNPRVQLKNYVTAVNVMALAATHDPRYRDIVANGAKFLMELQWDEGEGKNKGDNFYGGFGYDSQNRPDLSNTQFAIDALKAAGIPQNDEHFKKALVFISRCQNRKGETNDQPWADKINDGSFIYSAAGVGETKVLDTRDPAAAKPGYASMTYAGIKSMIYAGVSKNDPRVQAALAWIRKHYSVEENVGMPKPRNQQGLYYYYHTMAKCLDALGDDFVEDDKGVKRDWRKDITEALAKRQRPDGSWINESDRWMEGDPNLVTGYALMTLSYCKPKR
jgi:squalene-hopene/tetraprenyl-beta-curcumene cyclase